jgi:hypothetical protein
LEPNDSQVEGARSIDVDLVSADAEVAKRAGIRIAAKAIRQSTSWHKA